MPLPIEKVERVQPAYQFICKLEGIHIQASLGCVLPYRRPTLSESSTFRCDFENACRRF